MLTTGAEVKTGVRTLGRRILRVPAFLTGPRGFEPLTLRLLPFCEAFCAELHGFAQKGPLRAVCSAKLSYGPARIIKPFKVLIPCESMICVLRLGHRKARDKRVTTHVALVARAFGADKVMLSGERDDAVVESIKKVSKKWGGRFSARYEKNWKKALRGFKGTTVHLTMYGLPLCDVVGKLRGQKNMMVIVGAEKVPREVYSLADFNVSVTSQPHSEVAALAVFLHEFFSGKELDKKFGGAEIILEPSAKGKKFARK